MQDDQPVSQSPTRRRWRDRLGMDARAVRLMVLFLSLKAGLLVVALFATRAVPFNLAIYRMNIVLDLEGLPAVFRAFNTWDTQHYLLLAKSGYGVNPMSNAFFPLYPFLIRVFTPFFAGHALLAALFVSNVASLFVPVFMYRLCRLFFDGAASFRATLLLLAFPTAFYLTVAYTEALYLALTLAAFYYLFSGEMRKAAVVCFFLPLARAQALLFVIPIGVMFLLEARARTGDLRERVMAPARKYVVPLAATMLGMVAYLGFCRWQLGGFMSGLDAQRLYVAHNSLGNLLSPVAWYRRNFTIPLQLHGYTNSWLDRGAFLLAVPVLVGVFRREHKALFAYAAVTMLIPAFAGTFMSYTRMLLPVFPLFIYLGVRFRNSPFILAPMFLALQVLLFVLHTSGYWVA
jgi:hypothetical protein